MKLYVLTSPDDVAMIYRNNSTLSWDAMLNDLLVSFGIDPSLIPRLWQPITTTAPSEEVYGTAKIKPRLSIIHSTLDLYKKQLLPGPKLDTFSDKLLRSINKSICWERMSMRYGAGPSGQTEGISLKSFCDEVLVDAITRTLFGDRIYEMESDLIQSLLDFNDDAWMLVFKYPQSSGSKLNKARDKIIKGLSKYVQAPEELRFGQA